MPDAQQHCKLLLAACNKITADAVHPILLAFTHFSVVRRIRATLPPLPLVATTLAIGLPLAVRCDRLASPVMHGAYFLRPFAMWQLSPQ
jgi:hypothetical protein